MAKKIIISTLILVIFINNIVFADDEIEEEIDLNEILQTSTEVTDEPSINSRAAVVFERTTGTVLYGKNENVEKQMASTTKIMTAIIVIENADLNKTIEVSKKAALTGGSRLGLTTKAKITINDLLYGLMLCSGNDAAVALAEEVGGNIEGFSRMMNEKAQELRLTHTHFITPHGLDKKEHYTTAYELACITNYALNIEKFAQIVKTKNYTITINGNPKQIHNTNELLGNLNGVYGVKTGFTNGANRCLVTSVKRNNMDIICVVLGADTKKFRTQDSVKLIEFAFKNYHMINIEEIIKENFNNWKNENKIFIEKGIKDNIEIEIGEIAHKNYPIKNLEDDYIFMKVECPNQIKAPVTENEKIGKISVMYGTNNICNIDIVSKENVRKKNMKDYFFEILDYRIIKLNLHKI